MRTALLATLAGVIAVVGATTQAGRLRLSAKVLTDIENGDGGDTEDGDEGRRTTKQPKGS